MRDLLFDHIRSVTWKKFVSMLNPLLEEIVSFFGGIDLYKCCLTDVSQYVGFYCLIKLIQHSGSIIWRSSFNMLNPLFEGTVSTCWIHCFEEFFRYVGTIVWRYCLSSLDPFDWLICFTMLGNSLEKLSEDCCSKYIVWKSYFSMLYTLFEDTVTAF